MKKILLALLLAALLWVPSGAKAASVLTMVPNFGPKSGGTHFTIIGDFKRGSSVVIGGLQARTVTASNCDSLGNHCVYLDGYTPGLGFGTVGNPVSVIVLNPSGSNGLLVPGGFTYY